MANLNQTIENTILSKMDKKTEMAAVCHNYRFMILWVTVIHIHNRSPYYPSPLHGKQAVSITAYGNPLLALQSMGIIYTAPYEEISAFR